LVEGRENDPDPDIALEIRQLWSAERRVLLLVRALTAFYLLLEAVGPERIGYVNGQVSLQRRSVNKNVH
jgi:hypothetical protein